MRSKLSLHRLSLLCLALLVAGPSLATEDLTVKLPAAGEYLVWVEALTASGTQAQAPVRVTGDRAALTLPAPPAGLKEWRALALDEKSGYVAARSLPAKDTPAEVSFTTPDFNRVHRVRVRVTGAGEKPVAGASVILTDSKGGTLSRVIDAAAAGTAEFTDVPSGAAKLAVTTTGGKSTTKDIDINLPKGETAQTIAVPLPEVTAVVDAPAAAGAGSTSTSSPVATDGKTTADGTADTTTATDGGEKDAATETTSAAPAAGGGGLGQLVGLIVVLGALYLLYLKARNDGWTVDKVLARLGVQPVAPAPAGGGGGASGALGGPAAPAAPPVDPNVCAFCGQRKDPVTGACACSLDGAAGPASSPGSAGLGSAGGLGGAGSGPRLVAVSGLAMGQIFPIAGEAAIGRDPDNAVSLSMDTTVSRRHAVISPADGGYAIQDQGSSNGTFVNGARVTEAPLRPGDEVSIGGTRFRFEA